MAGERGYILGPRDGDRLRDMLRSQGERGQPRAARPRDPLVCFVRVTSGTATDGWYPGQWQEVQPDASMADGGDAWVRDAAGAALNNGAKYLTQCVGMDAGGVPMFATVAVSVAGGLSGVGVSPTPPLHVSTAGGVATVSIDDADIDAPGYVTATTQAWTGTKIAYPTDPPDVDCPNGHWGAYVDAYDVEARGGVYAYRDGGTLAGIAGDTNYAMLAVVAPDSGYAGRLQVEHAGTAGSRLVARLLGDSLAPAFAVGNSPIGIYTTRMFQGAGADANKTITWVFEGGLLVGEYYTGPSGTGSGGGGDTQCCPDVALPSTLTLTLPDTSTVTLTYASGAWTGTGGGYAWSMVCGWNAGEWQWLLTCDTDTANATAGGTCDPFDQSFDFLAPFAGTVEVTE